MSKAKPKQRPPGRYIAAADAFDGWRDDILTGKPPTLWPCGTGELSRFEIGPGLVQLVGGAPGSGKTGLVMQLAVDALRATPTLRALVCNVEMPPTVLLDRQLARLSGIALTDIRYRRLDSRHADRIDRAMMTVESFADRLGFLRPPYDLGNVAEAADDFGAGLLVLDYIQRIKPPGDRDGHRAEVNATMGYIREFADTGVGVVVVSAVGRTKDAKGRSSYAGDGLNLASFRESSELEFGADDAWILTPHGDEAKGIMQLKHLKSRHGEARDLWLSFDRPLQRFATIAAPGNAGRDAGGGRRRGQGDDEPPGVDRAAVSAQLANAWANTEAADDEAEGEAA